MTPLPSDAKVRKGIPIFSGCVAYFPHALAAVAQLSRIGNDQHNPGEPLHWAKDKSTDETDCLMRHLVDAAVNPLHRDNDGVLAAAKIAWRALANLERLHDAGHDILACESSSVASSGSSVSPASPCGTGAGASMKREPSAFAALPLVGVISTP